MLTTDRRDNPESGPQSRGDQPEQGLQTQEKTTLGGDFNSGVTSHDPVERDEIEKKGALANIDQSGVRTEEERKAEGNA